MLQYPQIDPVIVQLGPLAIRWYGLMYVIGFLAAWGLANYRAKKQPGLFTREQVADLIFYGALGVILGGRVGYMLFYDWSRLMAHPWSLLAIWQGGMSFHGGLLGVLIAMALFARKTQRSFFEITDFIAPLVPIGLAAGRLGNFINGELWGRPSSLPWAMIFPSGGDVPRHPSQLYEFLLEGVALFCILWFFSMKPKPKYAVSGLFLVSYGCFRFIVEFFRQPDLQLGFVAFGWLTQGQLLSLPMIIFGVYLLFIAYKKTSHSSYLDK